MLSVFFSTNDSLSAKIVRWATWSEFSHVGIITADGQYLSAKPNGGVVEQTLANFRTEQKISKELRVEIHGLSPEQEAEVLKIARGQVGKPYDWWGAVGIGIHNDWQHEGQWFCSEFVTWIFEKAGFPLINDAVSYKRISPQDLLLSPLL